MSPLKPILKCKHWSVDMDQLVKHLLYKYEDLTLTPGTHIKLDVAVHICKPDASSSNGRQKQEKPRKLMDQLAWSTQ